MVGRCVVPGVESLSGTWCWADDDDSIISCATRNGGQLNWIPPSSSFVAVFIIVTGRRQRQRVFDRYYRDYLPYTHVLHLVLLLGSGLDGCLLACCSSARQWDRASIVLWFIVGCRRKLSFCCEKAAAVEGVIWLAIPRRLLSLSQLNSSGL